MPAPNNSNPLWLEIVKAVAIPLVILGLGIWANITIADSQTQSDYVQLAISILSRETPEDAAQKEADGALRRWAVDVFAANSPVGVAPDVLEALKGGTVILSSFYTFEDFGRFGPEGALPESCFLIVNLTATVYDNLVSQTRGDRLAAGEYPALELRTPHPSTQLEQRVRIEEGWVEADPGDAYIECR